MFGITAQYLKENTHQGKQSMAAMEKHTKGVEYAVHVSAEETSLFRFNIQQLMKLTTSGQMILSLHQAKKLDEVNNIRTDDTESSSSKETHRQLLIEEPPSELMIITSTEDDGHDLLHHCYTVSH